MRLRSHAPNPGHYETNTMPRSFPNGNLLRHPERTALAFFGLPLILSITYDRRLIL
jgi:hypothetical protein